MGVGLAHSTFGRIQECIAGKSPKSEVMNAARNVLCCNYDDYHGRSVLCQKAITGGGGSFVDIAGLNNLCTDFTCGLTLTFPPIFPPTFPPTVKDTLVPASSDRIV